MSIDFAAGAAKAALANATGPAAAKTPPAPDAVERLRAATSGGMPADQPGPTPPQGTFQGAKPDGVPGTEAPGDRILRGLEAMSHNFQGAVGDVKASLDKPAAAMRPEDLLRTQYAVTQVTLEQDLLGKVVGKATSTIDTFLKNQ